MSTARPFSLISGTANPGLSEAIAEELGIKLSRCSIERFPDGEISIQLLEPVRHRDVFVMQPTGPPVNENLVELLALADACRRAAARHIIAIVPYFGYARADKRSGHRESVTARMVAELLETVGVSQVITIDLHAAQIEGFFHAPVDSLSAVPTLAAILRDSLAPGTVVVSPDAGRIHMAGEYAQRLGTSVVVLHKQRVNGSRTYVTHVVGDVRNRPCLIIDDMISTGNTIAAGIAALRAAGASAPFTVAATHGILLADARERITEAGVNLVYVTDTVAMHHREWTQLGVVSVAPLIAAAIRRISTNGSLSELYE